jgi:N-acyl-D-aspartate/D-glutamate deacylase
VSTLDLVVRGGTLIDGTGTPGRPADVGVAGDRVVAIGDLSAVDPASIAVVLDVPGRTVAPGFVDPHGHSDASVLVDGALASHLLQGFTTQLSGNCGNTLAPLTPGSRQFVDLSLAWSGVPAAWATFGEYLDLVDRQSLGPNVAFLVGHGTVRGAVIGATSRAASAEELTAMERRVEEALDAGAFGLSTGLIYAPGIHAPASEIVRLITAAARRRALYATHMRNESAGLFDALDEAIAVWGRGPAAVERLERARDEGLDVAADQYPYAAAATTLATILPPDLLASPVGETVEALAGTVGRARVRAAIEGGDTSWENVAADPGWSWIRISSAPSHPDWVGRDIAAIARDGSRHPLDVAFDALVDDRLDVGVVIDCMTEPDIEAIMAVPWIAVCTDASACRPGHPILGAGVPHPRAYGSSARFLGHYVRDRGIVPLETAVAKLTSVPAARIGLPDRGVVRVGAFADLVVFDPAAIADVATYAEPHRHPVGIEHVVVNGVPAVRDGVESGARPGRLLRREG